MSSYFTIQPTKDRLAYLCCYAQEDTKALGDIQTAETSYQEKIDDLKKLEPEKAPTWKKIDSLLKERNAAMAAVNPILERHEKRLQEVSVLGRFSPYRLLYWVANKIWGSADSFNARIQSWKATYSDEKALKDIQQEYAVQDLTVDKETIHVRAKWHPILDNKLYSLSKKVEIIFRDETKDILTITLEEQSSTNESLTVRCHLEVKKENPSDGLIVQALIVAIQSTKKLSENKKTSSFEFHVQKGTERLKKTFDKCIRDFDSNGNGVIHSTNYQNYSREVLGFKSWQHHAELATAERDLIPAG